MKEEKYIQSLFEKARGEEPQLSFEEASETFEASLDPGLIASIKDWFFSNVYLNSLIMISTIGMMAAVLFFNFQIEETQIAAAPIKEEIPELIIDSLVSDISGLETDDEIEEITTKTDLDKKVVAKTPITVPLETIQEYNNTSIVKAEVDSISAVTMSVVEEKTINKIANEPTESTPATVKKLKKKKMPAERGRNIFYQKRDLSELEMVLEAALNAEHLKEDLFTKDKYGEYHQLIMETNGKFNHLIDIQFAGKKVIVIDDVHGEAGYRVVDNEFINVQAFNIGNKKAILKFIYNSAIVEVELKKNDRVWYHRSSSIHQEEQDYMLREELVQIALDHPRMQEVIERDEDGAFKPLALLSNDLFTEFVKVTFDDKELKVVPNKYNRDFNRKIAHAEFTKLQIKRRKASIKFAYQGHLIEVNYRKKNGVWVMRSFSDQKGKSTYKHANF